MTMARLNDMRPVYVVGVGMHPYQFAGDTLYIDMGLTAVRGALDDAGIAFPEVESAYIGCTGIGMAAINGAAIAGAGLDPSPEEFSRIEEAVLSRLGCPASPSLMSAPDGTCSWEASIDALRAGVPLGE